MKLVKGELGFGVYSNEDWERYETLLKEFNHEIKDYFNSWCNGQEFLDSVTITDIEEIEFEVIRKLFLITNVCEYNVFGEFPQVEYVIDDDDEEE